MDMGIASACSTPILAPKSPQNLRRFRVYSSSSLDTSYPIREKTLSLIRSSGIIACLRANSAELAFEAASAALRGGISVLEIVMSTPGVLEVLQQLVQEYPAVTLGVIFLLQQHGLYINLLSFLWAGKQFVKTCSNHCEKYYSFDDRGGDADILQVGTVLNAVDARNAINVGAKFLMSPATVKGIMDIARDGEFLYIPGAMTPTEILSAHDAGAKIVKVYPVSALGGKNYISALKKPFPHIPLVASQGITIDSIGEYISSGASAVVLSDAIFKKDAMSQKNFDAIYEAASLAASLGQKAVTRQNFILENGLFPELAASTSLTN